MSAHVGALWKRGPSESFTDFQARAIRSEALGSGRISCVTGIVTDFFVQIDTGPSLKDQIKQKSLKSEDLLTLLYEEILRSKESGAGLMNLRAIAQQELGYQLFRNPSNIPPVVKQKFQHFLEQLRSMENEQMRYFLLIKIYLVYMHIDQ